ncbi:MAG: putative rane protein [Herbinix sp.]|jgi:membrane protease YdiL (CAAX protease family)|nr:putative rane protein [Herbinix sp.]
MDQQENEQQENQAEQLENQVNRLENQAVNQNSVQNANEYSQNPSQNQQQNSAYSQQGMYQQNVQGMYQQNSQGMYQQNGQGMYQQLRVINVYPPEFGKEDGMLGSEPQAPTKNSLSMIAFALFIMGIAVLLSQQLISTAVISYWPQIVKMDWYLWAITGFSMIGIALPVFYFLTKRLPEPKKEEVIKLKPLQFIMIFFICTAVMYITNFFSVFLMFLITLLKGGNLLDLNPLAEILIDSNLILRVLYAAVIAPIIEEIIFRKLLLNKLRKYGDVPAILLSAIAFGLFHMNVSQMFYATALGIIFAYVAIRTNAIRYNILLHILINTMGVVIAPLATQQNMIFSLIIVAWVFTCIVLGIVLFVVNVKKIKLYRAYKPMEKKSGYLLNVGTILYTAMCMAMVVAQIVAS